MNNCKRTATIQTANYSNFAVFTGLLLKNLPAEFLVKMRQNQVKYKDEIKLFKIKLLKQIEYFDIEETSNNQIFFDEIQYHMNKKVYEKGEIIIKEN